MPTKKTVTRKRKRTTRKKKVKAAEDTTGSTETTAEETVAADEVIAVEKPSAAKPEKRTTATRRKKTSRRSKKKKVADDESESTAEVAAPGAKTTAAGEAAAKPATVKRTRKRRTSKSHRAKKKAAPDEVVEQAPPSPTIKPISPTAKVEQSEDMIVIRFPSPHPPGKRTPTPPADEEEMPRKPGDTTSQAVPNGTYIEPIDWEEAEERPAASDEPGPVDDVSPPPPDETVTISEPRADKDEAAPTRSKRRRRRRKKDPRAVPEKETTRDEQPPVDEDRLRPEPAEGPGEATEPAPEETTTRRRRRRSRRGKKKEEAPAKPEEAKEVTKAPEPSGEKEMIINVVPREECRIAIMEEGKLQEIYLERASSENYVGNIYKGIITNVEPSIQAAFIDFGQGKNGFLHISDLHPEYFPNGEGNTENVGRKMPRRSRPPIQRCLRRGQQLLVQITKEGIGTKGPTLTTYLSIPGRFLVMMPGMRQLGVSRKIEDDEARRKLRDQLHELDLPENAGFIARTAALDHTKRELQSDLNYLSRLWNTVDKRIKNMKAPAEMYTESDLVIRTIRDVYTSDITRIVVDNADVAERAHEFLSIFSPRSRDIVVHFDDPEPIFHRYGIEDELEQLHSRHVPLKSGGSIVIDQTEALVAVDVNSGRFRAEEDAETTAYKIDLEAADEIPRQLRLRDLGGVVICDFIDVRLEKHKREIERRLNRNLKQHKERAKILRMSEFGIIEMTRQRQRASLTRNVYEDCRYCRGTGLVKTTESVVLDVMRLIQLAVTKENIRSIEVSVSAEVAHLLQNRKRSTLHELEKNNRRLISIRTVSDFSLDQVQIKCTDPRGRVVPHA